MLVGNTHTVALFPTRDRHCTDYKTKDTLKQNTKIEFPFLFASPFHKVIPYFIYLNPDMLSYGYVHAKAGYLRNLQQN